MNFSIPTNRLASVASIRICTGIFSLFFSIWAYHLDVVLNADGILYIHAIDAFKAGGLAATESLYNWPFFPIITAWLSEISGLNTEFSVKALNSVLFVLLTDALLLLSLKSLPNLRQLTIGAVLILGFSTLNDYRDFIIRDIGYWAFACYAFLQFLNFCEKRKLKHALLWQFFIIVALLFRIEALIFIAIVPLFVLFTNNAGSKWQTLFSLYSVTLALSALALLITWLHPNAASAFGKLEQLLVYMSPETVFSKLESGILTLKQEILHPAADEHAGRVLIFGLVMAVFWEMLVGLSIFYLILLGIAFFTLGRLVKSPHQRFFIFIITINFSLLILFALQTQLITTRYCVLGLLFSLLLLLPTFTAYIQKIIDFNQKKTLAVIVFIIFGGIADTLITTKAKPQLRTIPEWAAQNLPRNARVLTTDVTLQYYFNKYRQGTTVTLAEGLHALHSYDYLIIEHDNYHNPKLAMAESLSLQVVHQQGPRDNQVTVFKVQQNN